MAASWMLQSIFTSLLAQAMHPNNHPSPTVGNIPNVYRPVMRTNYGDLRGIQTKTVSGVLVDSFLGIPYATPPLGTLRFNKPIPTIKWRGVRDASQFGKECLQNAVPAYTFNVTDKPHVRGEDCLYLNIYKPVANSMGSMPVMVWIHGGGYLFGAGSQYEGSDLASKGVIVVTINYRVDVFGYLSNNDDVIPGNFGMLDQVLALKWIRSNIPSFGGDPNKVTIFGESAGSSSASLLIVSPLAKGLFNRAIMESGSSLAGWSVVQAATGVVPNQVVNLIGDKIGCNDIDAVKKLDCLRAADAEALLNASNSVRDALGGILHLSPVVENTFGFLPDFPELLLAQNKFNHVDTISGFNKAESGLDVLVWRNYTLTKQDFVDALKATLNSFAITDRDRLVENMFHAYVGNNTDGHSMLLQAVYAISDINFKGPALMEANVLSDLAPEKTHYVYEFDHTPGLSTLPSWMPATHAAELQFVFGVHLKQFQVPGKTITAEDKIVSEEVQTLWTNFAKFGDPTRTIPNGAILWNQYDSEKNTALRIKAKSEEISFKNHISQSVFVELKKRLSASLPDKFIVG